MPSGIYERISPEERFWSKVDKNGPVPEHCPELGQCWIWTACVAGSNNYGRFDFEGKSCVAHRFSFFLANNRWPNGSNPFILHKCDNSLCVRPEHLTEGNSSSNVIDCIIKDRFPRGEIKKNSKLTNDKVRKIRELYFSEEITQRELARQFGVNQRVIWGILNGEFWTHVT